VQPLPQKKVARAYRIEGSIVLYRLAAARSLSIAGRPLVPAEPRWRMVIAALLFLRTLLRLVFLCPHRHKGHPMTLRESIPSNRPVRRTFHGQGSYITCLDCGQKFAYNHMTRRLEDFWGVHDLKALAGVRRRIDGFFSPFRNLAACVGRLNMGTPMAELVRFAQRLEILTRGQWANSRHSIASQLIPRAKLQQTQTRPENN
jgi:hypothetical protein